MTAGPVSAATVLSCWVFAGKMTYGLTSETLGTSCRMSIELGSLAEQLLSDWSLADLSLTTLWLSPAIKLSQEEELHEEIEEGEEEEAAGTTSWATR